MFTKVTRLPIPALICRCGVDAEIGACQGKKDIAVKAKPLGYDAMHDTLHEMCKDEARHGEAFAGLLKRFF